MNIYQVFTGRWPQASIAEHNGQVFDRLSALDWQRLIQKGSLDAIYFLGVFDNRGPIIVGEEQGRALAADTTLRVPSPFAISNHSAFNPALGSQDSFRALADKVHLAGGKVVVDFVANHTAVNHPWVQTSPDLYVREGAGFYREFSGDVFKLNYQNPRVTEAQIEVLCWIAGNAADGVRCDMAHLVPGEFWRQAIATIKRMAPDFTFIAEAYADSGFDWGPLDSLLEAGFDGVYHEFLYRNLHKVFAKGEPFEFLTEHLRYVLNFPKRGRLVHYLANHDDCMHPQTAPYQEALMSLMLGLPGAVLIPNGQLSGMTRRLKHHELDFLPAGTRELERLPGWFEKLAQFKRRFQPLIVEINEAGPRVLACRSMISGGSGTLYANLSRGAWVIPKIPGHSGGGLLNCLSPGNALGPGQAEFMAQT